MGFIRIVLGEVSSSELALVALFFVCILLFSWAPRMGEIVGGLFDDDDAK